MAALKVKCAFPIRGRDRRTLKVLIFPPNDLKQQISKSQQIMGVTRTTGAFCLIKMTFTFSGHCAQPFGNGQILVTLLPSVPQLKATGDCCGHLELLWSIRCWRTWLTH